MSDGGRTIRTIGFAAPDAVAIYAYEEGPLTVGRFRVDTLYSGFSAGTELTYLRGTNPYLHGRWDAEYGVFRAGDPSQRLPVRVMGYMEVGRVTESRAAYVPVGQVVAAVYGHRTGHTIAPTERFFVPLPDDLDPLLGIYVAQMGPICANGILHAAADLLGPNVAALGDGVRGRHVLVVGGGVVGLLVALFAKLHGGAVLVAEQVPERLKAIRALGLEPLDVREAAAWEVCKSRWRHGPGDRGADVAFQCSGVGAGLQTALKSLRPQGTVIDMAFYQGSGVPEVRLGEEFHHNGLRIACAQIGRVPRGLGHAWGRRRLAAETVTLLRAYGPAIRAHLITDVVPFDDAPAAIAALSRGERGGIQLAIQVTQATGA